MAVVLFNLGGPDNLSSVQPFLFNLFNDPAIINIPKYLRWLLAKFISKRRTKTAQEIYKKLGGKSPILGLTLNQAAALKEQLAKTTHREIEIFVCMRYRHSRIEI